MSDSIFQIYYFYFKRRCKLIMRIFFLCIYCFFLLLGCSSRTKGISITIHHRGSYESKISLIPQSGKGALKPFIEKEGVKKGQTVVLQIPDTFLPGEFILRFDYKQNPSDQPYPAEKRIIINRQDLELWVHPVYCNNPDSTWFQKDEKENRTFAAFMVENSRRKEKIGLLQNLLFNYDDTGSELYRMAIIEYEKRRKDFNDWIVSQRKQYKSLFASTLFSFQYIQQINWKGNEFERKKSLRDNYFEGIDFRDTMLIKTPAMKEWMDAYVNLYGELVTNITMRDSLFTLAGKTAIEKAKTGHPLLYGWMVDYFFNGYESFNIERGIKMLRPYVDDPNCLLTKRKEISMRITGINTLKPGTTAPNIIMEDSDNRTFNLYANQTLKKFTLVIFWSADCSHCNETVGMLSKLYLREDVRQRLDIVAISVDETDTEIRAWKQKISEMKTWKHLRAEEGIRSKVANDYYVLGIPVMVLIDSKTRKIIGLPAEVMDLERLLRQ